MPSDPTIGGVRLSATILIVRDDPLEVLTVRRHAHATFASAIVFPGGVVDEADRSEEWLPLVSGADDLGPNERAIRIAGIRETYEETSLLLAHLPDGGHVAQPAAPHPTFRETVRASGGTLALDDIRPFGHWITPEGPPKRFDTRFLLARAPRNQTAVADGVETVDIEWARPSALIERAQAGERAIMLPTYANLLRLAESEDADEAFRKAAGITPYPVIAWQETLPDGTRVHVIPAEAAYGFTEFPV